MKRPAAAALLLLFALARWLLMARPAPYKALLPAPWFAPDALGLTRLSLNAFWCALLLGLLPLVVARRSGAWDAVRPMLVPDPGALRRGWAWAAAGAALAVGLACVARNVDASLCVHYPLHASLLGESLYLVVILSTEVFYRGVLLVVWERAFGGWALLAMAVACALDHIGAPAIELLSSGFGALLLGWVALRVRSVWPGFVAHAALAMSIDAGCWPLP